MTLRELVFVFTASGNASVFRSWASAYFVGALDGSGSQLLSDRRVKVRGVYAQEILMFAREADKLGGVIEIQPQDLLLAGSSNRDVQEESPLRSST